MTDKPKEASQALSNDNTETLQQRLGRIKVSSNPSKTPDALTVLEQEREIYDHKEHKQNIEDRRIYRTVLFCLMCGWICFGAVCVFLSGFHPHDGGCGVLYTILNFNLPTSVLISLIGGTTVNLIGLFVIVIKHLYNDTN